MGKYNVVMKRKRAEKAVRKREIHGDPITGKLKNKAQSLTVSGKRQRKLFKKQRRQEKEQQQQCSLITMGDVEMATVSQHQLEQGASEDTNKTVKFPVKKTLKLKQIKRRGRKTKKASKLGPAEASVDSMVE